MEMIDDTNLIERTRNALEDFGDSPWLPDLTDDLVKRGWRVLQQEIGLSPSSYATSRVIAKSVHAPRNLVGHVATSLPVEFIEENQSHIYQDVGIKFYTKKEISGADLLRCVEDAMSLVKQVPTLYTTVVALVKSLHLINPKDDDFDVSFSEPQIPFSIFVSVPQTSRVIERCIDRFTLSQVQSCSTEKGLNQIRSPT